MTELLDIRAGKAALAHIRKNGLCPSDIRVITGASGAAKWLGIYGLYRAIFSQWLPEKPHPVFLFGTSIGAWTLAAGAQSNPGQAFDRLKTAYIGQVYQGKITPEKITRESLKILAQVFSLDRISEILSHPFLTLGFSAVRCRGPMAIETQAVQTGAMAVAFGLNLISRKTQGLFFDRTLFHTPVNPDEIPLDFGRVKPRYAALDHRNFQQALLASGSIPVIMEGIRNISGAPDGMYRDGGVLDYHPALSIKPESDGFLLFPHFYPWITPGWFDKALSWRRASGAVLDRTILLSPSQAFLERLPMGRIPDRKDFLRFQGREAERFGIWEESARMSLELGESFLEVTDSGKIKKIVKEI